MVQLSNQYTDLELHNTLRQTDRWQTVWCQCNIDRRCSPRLSSRLGRGPLPIPFPPRRHGRLDLGAYDASVALNTNSWLRLYTRGMVKQRAYTIQR